jgi:DNA-directed RNA polymerase subunit alpha
VLPEGIFKEEVRDNYGKFIFEPLERGYGVTIGNSLRRILLSSVTGAAIVAVKIDEIYHEFTSIPGVLEDVPQIMLNLKKVRFRFDDPEATSAVARLVKEGEGEVIAKDIEVPAELTLITPDVHIATLTAPEASLRMQLTIWRGRGYVPAEEIPKSLFPEGTQILDGVFSPVTKVNYHVENVLVKARTDFERLILEIWTDGSVAPDRALEEASLRLKDAVDRLFKETKKRFGQKEIGFEEREKIRSLLKRGIEFLEPTKRTVNCLKEAGIETIADLVSKTEEEMLQIKNFGEKSLEEIKEKLAKFDLSFGMDVEKYLSGERI